MSRFVVCVLGAVIGAFAVRPSAQSCERNAPLTEQDVLRLIEAGVPSSIVQNAIAGCGTTFILDESSAQKLRASGGSDPVVNLLAGPSAVRAGTVWNSPIDRMDMVWIPPGEFQMGSPASEAGRNEDEMQHVVRIERGFWIDSGEVTNAAFRRFVVANPSWRKDQIERQFHDGNYLQDWRGIDFPEGKADSPVVWVTWPAATAYAAWAGKQLPTEVEWEYAARSGAQTPYWWGEAFDPSRVAPLGPAGDRALLKSPWGTIGMIGSVWEWTASEYTSDPSQRAAGRDDASQSGARVKRGGFWNSGERFLRTALRSREQPELTSDVLGFRCAR